MLQGGLFPNWGPFISGATKIHSTLGFTVLFICSRYPVLSYRKILLIQQAQDQIGTGLLVNYQMVLVIAKIFTGNCYCSNS